MNKIGFLGIPGSYSHIAARKYFNDTPSNLIGYPTFKDIFEAIKKEELAFGVVPIENTLAGSIYENYDMLDSYEICIVGECHVKVEHNLLVTEAGLKAIKAGEKLDVYSHPKALEQCANYLEESGFHTLPYGDTATAARYVADKKLDTIAAIASKEAGDLYGLKIAASSIQSNPENYTRFLVVGHTMQQSTTQANKCSMILYMPHVKGSLYSALGVLVRNDCNLMKIESRPLIGKPFEYVFYFDFQYDSKLHNIEQIMNEMKKLKIKPVVLGVYRADKLGK